MPILNRVPGLPTPAITDLSGSTSAMTVLAMTRRSIVLTATAKSGVRKTRSMSEPYTR